MYMYVELLEGQLVVSLDMSAWTDDVCVCVFDLLTCPCLNWRFASKRRNKFQAPTIDEGFSEIVKVNVIPSFESEEQEQLYMQYLLS